MSSFILVRFKLVHPSPQYFFFLNRLSQDPMDVERKCQAHVSLIYAGYVIVYLILMYAGYVMLYLPDQEDYGFVS